MGCCYHTTNLKHTFSTSQSVTSELKFSTFIIYFLILLVNKYLLRTYNMPDTVLRIMLISVKKKKKGLKNLPPETKQNKNLLSKGLSFRR